MLIEILLVTHVVVLGYWLGAEFVINSGYRYVCLAANLPFEQRDKLMDHVLDVDQHVRYALVLQIGLGTILAILYGFIPGSDAIALGVALITLVWLVFVEVIHRKRKEPMSALLGFIDRSIRYIAMMGLTIFGVSGLITKTSIPAWLAWKLLLFAAVILCGVGIRYSIIEFYRTWAKINRDGSTPEHEQSIWVIYKYGTGILMVLWVFVFAIAVLSVWKP